MNYNKNKYIPHLLAILIFIVVSFVYFSPVLNDKQLQQGDMMQFQGMSKALDDYHKTTGKYSQWLPNMFSGMPSYQVGYGKAGNLFQYILPIITLGNFGLTVGVFFLLALGFYIFMYSLTKNNWLSIFAGLLYALGSYNIIIIGAGHITKGWAMAMMAPILAGIILVFNKEYLKGILIFTLSLVLQLTFNHIQITYYTIIVAVIIGISYFIFAIKTKQIPEFAKGLCILTICAIISLLPVSGHLIVNNQYAKYTMRGGSELTTHPQNSKQQVNDKGLDINYAFSWSYGKDETLTLLIPDYMGSGSSDVRLHSADAKYLHNRMTALQSNKPINTNPKQVEELAYKYLSNTYYGEQSFTSGPVYFGAIIIFLSLIGFILLDNKYRWWLLVATILSILLSWGKNFMFLNEFLFNNLPYYNKFRTPSMALVIANVTMCVTAILGLKIFLESNDYRKKTISLYISLIITGGITLIGWLIPNLISDFSSITHDSEFAKQLGENFIVALQQDRRELLSASSLRSLMFIVITFVVLLLYNGGKIKKQIIVICIIGIVGIIDLWNVDTRFVNKDSFVSKYDFLPPITNAQRDISDIVNKQNINHFRVYNLAGNTFNEANTSYSLPSIGGYSAAKLQRYQDLIDFYFYNKYYKQKDINDTSLLQNNQLRQLLSHYQNNPDFPMPNIGVLNMLDTKYILLSENNYLENSEALGSAWFVNDIQLVNSADEEIAALNNFNPKQKAIINKNFSDCVKTIRNIDTTATITLSTEDNNDITHLKYKTSSKSDQIAIFSEIYYKDSWHAFIDGKEVPYFCANYVLRGLYIPKGDHTIEFKCYNNTLKIGSIISLIGSIFIILFVITIILYPFYKNKQNKQLEKPIKS